jgi:hypothetical protein
MKALLRRRKQRETSNSNEVKRSTSDLTTGSLSISDVKMPRAMLKLDTPLSDVRGLEPRRRRVCPRVAAKAFRVPTCHSL